MKYVLCPIVRDTLVTLVDISWSVHTGTQVAASEPNLKQAQTPIARLFGPLRKKESVLAFISQEQCEWAPRTTTYHLFIPRQAFVLRRRANSEAALCLQ